MRKKKKTPLNGRNLTGQAPLDKRDLTGQAKSVICVNPFLNPSLSVIITAVFAVVIMGVLRFGESAIATD